MSSIGIMDPAFFVGKNVLLKWLNDFFDAGYTKVEQTATGAMHCQIFDAIYPGKVPLGKVNFDAKYDYEYVQNFKILQSVFDQQQIIKHIDVAKLVKAKYQDNLEMLQWVKHYFDTHYSGQEYNAKERREQAKLQYKKGHKFAGSTKEVAKKETTATANTENANEQNTSPTPSPAKPKPAPKPVAAAPAAAKPVSSASRVAASKPAAKPVARRAVGASSSSSEVSELNDQLAKLRLTIEGLEKERNFYFGKLREIEILCQDESGEVVAKTPEVEELKKKLLAILYATDESNEFQVPDDQAQTEQEPTEQTEEGLL